MRGKCVAGGPTATVRDQRLPTRLRRSAAQCQQRPATAAERAALPLLLLIGIAGLGFASAGVKSITVLSGHFTTSIAPGNEMPAGVYYVTGKGTRMTLNPDGTKTLVLGKNGSAENLCVVLVG